jgi:hypothetical protein
MFIFLWLFEGVLWTWFLLLFSFEQTAKKDNEISADQKDCFWADLVRSGLLIENGTNGLEAREVVQNQDE